MTLYFSRNLSPNVFPLEFPFFCHKDGSLRRSEQDYYSKPGDNDASPVHGQPRRPVTHLHVGLIWWRRTTLLFFFLTNPLKQNPSPAPVILLIFGSSQGRKMADLEAVLADVSYLMAMEKSKSTPAARASKKIILPEPR